MTPSSGQAKPSQLTSAARPAKPSQLTPVIGVTAALPAPSTASTLTLSTASDVAIVHVPSAVTEQLEPGTASHAAQLLAPKCQNTVHPDESATTSPGSKQFTETVVDARRHTIVDTAGHARSDCHTRRTDDTIGRTGETVAANTAGDPIGSADVGLAWRAPTRTDNDTGRHAEQSLSSGHSISAIGATTCARGMSRTDCDRARDACSNVVGTESTVGGT